MEYQPRSYNRWHEHGGVFGRHSHFRSRARHSPDRDPQFRANQGWPSWERSEEKKDKIFEENDEETLRPPNSRAHGGAVEHTVLQQQQQQQHQNSDASSTAGEAGSFLGGDADGRRTSRYSPTRGPHVRYWDSRPGWPTWESYEEKGEILAENNAETLPPTSTLSPTSTLPPTSTPVEGVALERVDSEQQPQLRGSVGSSAVGGAGSGVAHPLFDATVVANELKSATSMVGTTKSPTGEARDPATRGSGASGIANGVGNLKSR